MKNFILNAKPIYREFFRSFSVVQHLLYGLLIPLLLLISLLAWDPKVFVFIFLAYSCGLIGFMFAMAISKYTQVQNAQNETTLVSNTLPKTESMPSPSPLNLGNLMTAHDLKEPLRQVYCYAQLLEKRHKSSLNPQALEYLDYVLDGAKRMSQMMEDISALNRVEHEATRIEEVDLSDILLQTFSSLKFKIQENDAQLTHDPMPVIQGDPGQLRHLFLNLVGNALKYRGEVSPRIHVSVDQQPNTFKIVVHDNGIGIAKEQLGEVFGLFRRLQPHSKFEGTGVGLAICKRIVENHSGEIGVESDGIGKGSRFWVKLPKNPNFLEPMA